MTPRLGAIAATLLLALGCSREDAARAARAELAPPPQSGTPSAPNAELPLTQVEASGQLGPGRGTLIVDIRAPKGAQLTEGAPLVIRGSGQDLSFPKELHVPLDSSKLPIKLPIDVADGALGPAKLELSYYYCQTSDHGSCRPERAKLSVKLDLSGSAPGGEAHLVHRPIL